MFFSDLSISEDLTIRYLRRVVWELRTLFAPMPFTPTSVTRMQETGQMLENPLHTVTKSPFFVRKFKLMKTVSKINLDFYVKLFVVKKS